MGHWTEIDMTYVEWLDLMDSIELGKSALYMKPEQRTLQGFLKRLGDVSVNVARAVGIMELRPRIWRKQTEIS